MKENVSRTGSPGVRLGLALALSLVLHAVLLAPWPLPPSGKSVNEPPPTPMLEATLLAPVLKTRAVPPEPEMTVPQPAAVLSVPQGGAATSVAPKVPSPRPLAGRALNTALAAIAREDFYPRAAIERGIEGRVVLLLHLSETGGVTGIEVASGSGHELLDAAAVRAAGRIGRLPGGRRQVLLPVEFRLD